MTKSAWLIEAPGKNYLGFFDSEGSYFSWVSEDKALRFHSKEDADLFTNCVLCLDKETFFFEKNLSAATSVEYFWSDLVKVEVNKDQVSTVSSEKSKSPSELDRITAIDALPPYAKQKIMDMLNSWGRECAGGDGDSISPHTKRKVGEIYFAAAQAILGKSDD